MERLTWKNHDGSSAYVDMDGNMVSDYDTASVLTGRSVDKLAEYEDLEEQGLLLRLPCKIGDTVFRVWTVGGKRTVAKFCVTDFRLIDGKWYALVSGANSHLIRQWKFKIFGKIIFCLLNKPKRH